MVKEDLFNLEGVRCFELVQAILRGAASQYKKVDAISNWTLGAAGASAALFVANIDKLSAYFAHAWFNRCLGFILLSIAFGLGHPHLRGSVALVDALAGKLVRGQSRQKPALRHAGGAPVGVLRLVGVRAAVPRAVRDRVRASEIVEAPLGRVRTSTERLTWTPMRTPV
jgi:hypothetical protein